ncbi:MAG: glutathione S-transferase family protein [Pseudomonadota bacterium]
MIFYDAELAPSPRRARMLIAEKDLVIETVQVSLREGEQFDPWFKAINPACTVPALKLDNGTVLTENGAIAVYLEASHPEPPLLGTTPLEKAVITNWNERCVLEGFGAVAESFRNFSRGFRNRSVTGQQSHPQIPELVERGRARAALFFDELDTQLQESDHLAGPDFTMADITALCLVDFAKWIKLEVGDQRPGLRRWYEMVSERPSAKL